MNWNKKIVAIVLWIIIATINSYGATTLTAVSKIVDSGISTPNKITDKVNGRLICPDGNDNSNIHPGCDVSSDVGYDSVNNKYSGDLIVRTGDKFTVAAAWNITGGNGDVTITSTLPKSSGVSWSKPLNSLCADGSSISEDGLKLTCIRRGYTSNKTSYSEDTEFVVDVARDVSNGTKTGKFTFNVASGDIETTATSSQELTITASPRWNLQIFPYTTIKYNNNGVDGYAFIYSFSIEVDEVDGEEDTAVGYLGNESLGKNRIITFTADLNSVSPNVELIECKDKNALMFSMPYPYYHADEPERSLANSENSLNLDCNQAKVGDNISVTYSGLDLSLSHVATKNMKGGSLPITRKVGAIGRMILFIPNSDFKLTQEHEAPNGDKYYQIKPLVNLINFDPDSISGISNFGTKEESLKDNSYQFNLKYYPNGNRYGYAYINFRDANGTNSLPESIISGDGKGKVTPGSEFTSKLGIQNRGAIDFNKTMICDVIDINSYDISRYSDGSDPVKVTPPWKYPDTNVTVEYAVGYVTNMWDNHNPATDYSEDVIRECSDTTITWYTNFNEAKAAAKLLGSAVSKVRLKLEHLNSNDNGKSVSLTALVHHNARAVKLDGTPLNKGSYLLGYMADYNEVTHKEDSDHWVAGYKDLSLKRLSQYPEVSDRLILVRAKARINQKIDKTQANIGSKIAVSVQSSLTSDTNTLQKEQNLTIWSNLPKGIRYLSGTATLGEPKVLELANGDSKLVWSLGEYIVNKPIPDLNFSVIVEANAKKGNSSIVTHIEAPTLDIDNNDSMHTSENRFVINIPVRMMITKAVITPFVPTNTEISYESYVRNGTNSSIEKIDIIDTLPFIGDGIEGFDIKMGSNLIHHLRAPATNFNGSLEFKSAEGKDECTDGVDWYYSNTNPKNINLSPKDSSNKLDSSGTTNWCEGDTSGPYASCGFSNSDVTAVRMVKTTSVATNDICTLKVTLDLQDNKVGDIYTSTTGASSDSVTLPVVSNDVYATVPTSTIGDFVWLDSNKNGIQDDGEKGISGIKVILYKDDGNGDYIELKSMKTDAGYYKFTNLDRGSYKIGVDLSGTKYKITDANSGSDDNKDSDINPNSAKTDPIYLLMKKIDNSEDIGLIYDADILISGIVYDDGNGDGNINGEAISNLDGAKLYVTLLDEGRVLASKELDANGKYTFTQEDGLRENRTYKVILSTKENSTTPTLPEEWNSADGEKSQNNKTNGNDGNADAILEVVVGSTNVLNNDFGVNKKPIAENKSTPIQVNPEGNKQVKVPTLSGYDKESGNNLIYTIVKLPTNAKLYCDGTEIATTDTICKPDKLTVDPDDGEQVVIFKYTTTDKAGVASKIATVKMPFKVIKKGVSIGDFIWYDDNLNGIQDKNEPGVFGVKVSLLSSNRKPVKDIHGNIVKPTQTDKSGHYEFKDIVANADYIIKVDIPNSYLPALQNRGSDKLDSNANRDGEIYIQNLQHSDYSLDIGIYCECDDYKVHPNEFHELKMPAISILGIVAMITALLVLVRRED